MKIYTNDLVKGHSDFKVKCLTFGLYTQVSDSGPLGPLVIICMYISGPFWICTTLVFTTAIAGNLANYLASGGKDYQWKYDFHKGKT